MANSPLCVATPSRLPSGTQARGCGLRRPLLVDNRAVNRCLAIPIPMAAPPRELIWKAPYKPARTTESESIQASSAPRRSSSLSPKSRPTSAVRPEAQFSFPRRSLLPQDGSVASRPFLNCQSPLTLNMSDPTTVNEVGSSNFLSEKLRGPGASSYCFFPSLTAPGSQAEKLKMIASLRNHSVNTLAELRRIERIFATMGTSDVTEPMTTACMRAHVLM